MSDPRQRELSERSELIHDVHDYCINIDTKEIWLHGSYDTNDEFEEPGVDWRMANRFEKNLRLLEKFAPNKPPILIHMHTVGGIWEDGMAIYDAIKTCHSHVTILAYGSARSMSSIIFQAADDRVMMPNCIFMMHYGSLSLDCNAISAYSSIDFTRKTDEVMLDIYVDKCVNGTHFKEQGKKDKAVRAELDKQMRFKQEVYLTSRETVNWGLADAVLGDEGYKTIRELRETTS